MPVIALGIDPGTRHLGWGIVSADGPRLQHVAHGVVHTLEGAPLADRLVTIDDALAEILRVHTPTTAGVEAIFFAKDAQAAAKLGHARGVVLLALCRAKMPIREYPPAQVKRAIAGRGAADKLQVARVVSAMLGLASLPPADAADALAIAITHARADLFPAPPARSSRGRGALPPHLAAAAALAASRKLTRPDRPDGE
jgi:crossover junction endodeoxyribonuclease RuvC